MDNSHARKGSFGKVGHETFLISPLSSDRENRAITAGIQPSYYDFWMGHINMRAETNLDDSYFRAEESEHVEQYKKAISRLTIFQNSELDEFGGISNWI